MIDQVEQSAGLAAEAAGRGGDAGACSAEAEEPDRRVTQSRHHAGKSASTNLGVVLAERHVADPVDLVLCDTRSRIVSGCLDWRSAMPSG